MSESRLADEFKRARRALDELNAHGLAPTPANIAVWTAYLQGAPAPLVTAVDAARARDGGLTDTLIQTLYVEHVVFPAEQALDISDLMSAQLNRTAADLAQANADTARYGAALDGASTALRSQLPASALETLVGNLMRATEHMRERTRVLEEKLADTSKEVGALRDNLERVSAEALSDPLTGAANRKRFDDFLERARSSSAATGAPLSLILCDIDHFKKVNDTWGHSTGDQIIRFVARALEASADEGHLVARYGGEEFAIVAPGLTSAEAETLADRVRITIESKVLRRRSTNESLGGVTASFGVAQLLSDEESWQLIERADQALYDSKHSGRNQVTAASPLKAAS